MTFARLVSVALAASPVALASPLLAQDYSFQFANTSNVTLAEGFLTLDPTVNTISPFGTGPFQSQTVTAMTGTYLGETITFVVNPDAPNIFGSNGFLFDNQILLNSPSILDPGGLVFTTPTLGAFNIAGFGQGDYAILSAGGVIDGTFSISLVTANVPEPGTWAMMLLGFGAVGISIRRSRRKPNLSLA